jgi:predicted transcriptional regulator
MDLLWDRDGWLSPSEVHSALQTARPLAYTTVMTVLVRLWTKGRLERQADGRAYVYRPLATREQHAAVQMHEVLETAGNQPRALSFFIESLTPAERTQLRRLLNERGRGRT